MRVLHVIPGLGVRTGGPAAAVVGASRALRDQGVECAIFATDVALPANAVSNQWSVRSGDVPDGLADLDVRLFPARRPRRLLYSPALARELAEQVARYDVVHIHSLYLYPQFAAHRAAKGSRRPWVVSPRGALDPWLRRRGRGRKAAAEWLWQRSMLAQASGLHLTSEEEARLIADIVPSVPRYVVPNGVEWSVFQQLPSAEGFRSRHLNGSAGPLVLNIGRLSAKKGLDVLIRAFALVTSKRSDALLALVGPDDEDLGRSLRALGEQLGIADRLFMPGLLTGPEKLSALAAAAVWCLPSHTENFGIAVVEAMAAGVPVIITPGVNLAPEVAREQAAIVCEQEPGVIAEEVLGLIADDGRRSAVAMRGREFARRYDWSVSTRGLRTMYADVIAQHRAANGVAG